MTIVYQSSTDGGTWTTWCDSSTTSSSTTDHTWTVWCDSTGSVGSVELNPQWIAHEPLAIVESPEEAAARAERNAARLGLERLERKRLEREREEAKERAIALLRESLDEQQRESFDSVKWFMTISKSGKKFRIRHGWAGNIDELDDQDRIVAEYCIHPSIAVPFEDSMLVQKLMLEHEEERFLQVANKTRLENPQPLAV